MNADLLYTVSSLMSCHGCIAAHSANDLVCYKTLSVKQVVSSITESQVMILLVQKKYQNDQRYWKCYQLKKIKFNMLCTICNSADSVEVK